MLRFTGSKLERSEMQLLRRAAQFTLDKFLSESAQEKIKINIDLDEDYTDGSGECTYLGMNDGIKKFAVIINPNKINRRAKDPFLRLKNLIETVIHEMIHVKQYAKCELFDYVNGSTKYQGYVYSDFDYWESPWEIEAYGRTEGIFRKFKYKIQKGLEGV